MKDHYVQWGFDLVKNAYLNREIEPDPKDDLYLNYLRPFSSEFFGINNPALIFGGHDFRILTDKPILTLRDGLLPLTIFFRDVAPADVNCEIHIHKDLWFIVPEPWKKKVKFYEVKADGEYSSEKLPKKIFISGILNSTLADPEEFESHLKRLSDVIGKANLEKIEIYAYFPDKRNDLWGSWEEENVLRYSKYIFEHLKLDIKTPEWRLISAEQEFKDCLYYEVNAGLFIQDSFVKNMFLSKGAGLLESSLDDRFKVVSEIRASLHHKYVVYEILPEKDQTYVSLVNDKELPYFQRITSHEFDRVKFNFEWEKWYAFYIKKALKHRKAKTFQVF